MISIKVSTEASSDQTTKDVEANFELEGNNSLCSKNSLQEKTGKGIQVSVEAHSETSGTESESQFQNFTLHGLDGATTILHQTNFYSWKPEQETESTNSDEVDETKSLSEKVLFLYYMRNSVHAFDGLLFLLARLED